ncbi:MAG: hypothetical protein WBG51_06690, partial [Syntrophobacteria bacterium]
TCATRTFCPPFSQRYRRYDQKYNCRRALARIFHESLAATTDMAVLPGVLGCSFDYAQDRLPLRRTVQVRLGTNPLR